MEFWQFAVTCAAVLYVVERIVKVITTNRQRLIEKKIIALQVRIEAVHKEVWPMFELWWNDEGGKKLATEFLKRENDDTPELLRRALLTEMDHEVYLAVGHYALDLKAQPLHEKLERLLVKGARTPSDRHEAQCAITERKGHMRKHEEELLRIGYKLPELAERFGPSH